MNVSDALAKRKSVRAFTDQAVDTKIIRELLTSAGKAPSGVNTQPWQACVLTGESKKALESKMEAAFRQKQPQKMDYLYYPEEWQEPFRSRRKECGLLMYSTLEIGREDKERQIDQWAANYRSFDAPVMLIFYIDSVMQQGSYLDFGLFLQSLMLAATEKGVGTCPQAALGEYPDIVREYLGLDDNMSIVCGMAMGYEDSSAVINSYRTPREPIDNWVTFKS